MFYFELLYPFPNKINMKKLTLQSVEELVGSSRPFFVTGHLLIEMNSLKPFFYRILPRYLLKIKMTPLVAKNVPYMNRYVNKFLTYVYIEK